MNWSESLSMGVKGLLLRKLRSLLSTLGIVFGVGAVIAMMSIGEGARTQAVEQIELLGTNNIRIKRLTLTGERREQAEQAFSRGLTHDDAVIIRESLPELAGVAPIKFVDAEVRYEGRQAVAQVVGTTPEHETVTNFRVEKGRFLTELDVAGVKNVCVLGSEVRDEMFGPRNALGAEVRLGTRSFVVVGTMESKTIREGRTAAIKVRNINRDVYVPITSALRRFPVAGDAEAIDEIAARVRDSGSLGSAEERISAILERRHRSASDYEILIPEELLAQAVRTQRLFTIVMGSIAGISLLVGGIGIMNIMLANVSERTREIGIRRAIGASKADVMTQFLIETVLICLSGGILGILLGVGLGKFIMIFAGWETGFSPWSVVIAFGTSVTVGLVFGLVPAQRAAQLDPVRAIRFE